MAFYGPRFLDDLRAALPVYEVVSKRHKLRKRGASEYVAIDDNSLTVNTTKNIWNDFSKGAGGDIFAYQQFATGCNFEQAVEELARMAGMRLPKEAPRTNGSGNGHYANGHSTAEPEAAAPQTIVKKVTPRIITATYDYQDADGNVIYQVVRQEWTEDGKKRKMTPPRRPSDDEPDRWIWGVKGGEYLRGKNGDWYSADARRKKEWRGAELRRFDAIAPTLYRLPDILEELRQEPDEQRVIFIPEGEKCAQALIDWGFLATTSMGGTNGWQAHFAEYLAGADVVIQCDNDDAGRRFAEEKAASLRTFARKIRMLDWPEVWPDAPAKADVVDWRDQAGGTPERLCEIIDRLPEWTARPPVSSFNAQRFVDIDRPGTELEWLIKGVLTRGEVSIWFGQWGSGKSFLITDAALAIARNVAWMGMRVRPGLVIYQAGEGGLGLKRRLRAYRKHNHIPEGEDLPFVLLPSRIDIFSSDADVEKLIAEIRAWTRWYGFDRPELVIIDTLNASSPGADENASRDIGPVMNRARRISLETGAHVALVDHTPKDGGSPRGWSGKMGNVDNAVAVSRVDRTERELSEDGSHFIERDVREWTVAKQKDEADRKSMSFVLKQVKIGVDREGDPITSCVVAPLAKGSGLFRRDEIPKDYTKLLPANEDLMRCLVKALRDKGRQRPAEIDQAPPGGRVVLISDWQNELIELSTGHEEITPTLRQRIVGRIKRATNGWLKINLIGKQGEYVWRTSRKIHMIDDPPAPPKQEQKPLLAPGESEEDLHKDMPF